MDQKKVLETERAFRILIRINDNHLLLATIYENLVDRDFKSVEDDIKSIISDLKSITKSIEEDDF